MAPKAYESKQAVICDCGHDYATHEKSSKVGQRMLEVKRSETDVLKFEELRQ
jgi:hypothetical protein